MSLRYLYRQIGFFDSANGDSIFGGLNLKQHTDGKITTPYPYQLVNYNLLYNNVLRQTNQYLIIQNPDIVEAVFIDIPYFGSLSDFPCTILKLWQYSKAEMIRRFFWDRYLKLDFSSGQQLIGLLGRYDSTSF